MTGEWPLNSGVRTCRAFPPIPPAAPAAAPAAAAASAVPSAAAAAAAAAAGAAATAATVTAPRPSLSLFLSLYDYSCLLLSIRFLLFFFLSIWPSPLFCLFVCLFGLFAWLQCPNFPLFLSLSLSLSLFLSSFRSLRWMIELNG